MYLQIRRGGLTTFHGHGQLVCYPILNLRKLKVKNDIFQKLSLFYLIHSKFCCFQLGVKEYVRCLEETAIRTCAEFGVQAHTTEHVGVWVGGHKICAIGQ